MKTLRLKRRKKWKCKRIERKMKEKRINNKKKKEKKK